MVLDDTWMPSIKTVLSLLEKNRPDFERLYVPRARAAVFRKVGLSDGIKSEAAFGEMLADALNDSPSFVLASFAERLPPPFLAAPCRTR